MKKYLDYSGLQYFWNKLKDTFSTKEAVNTLISRIEKLESYHSSLALNNKNIEYTPAETSIYNIYYADENGILSNYDKICSFNATANTKVVYEDLNNLNVAPQEATRIVSIKENTTEIVDSISLTDSFKISSNFGLKLYSVGLLSDIHIDGNGDGNNNDSGNSNIDFQNALEYFNNTENVDFISVCGDITYYGYLQDYQKYNQLVSQYSSNTSVKTIRGNHECYVNGSNNYNSSNTQYQDNIGPLYYEYIHNNDIYLFVGLRSEGTSDPFLSEEIDFLKTKLNLYKNQRVFLFVHFYYGEVGNVNGISTHSEIGDTQATGKQFVSLIKHFKNVIYFSGHTHLDFRLQQYGKNANIQERGNICHRVHIPSCSKPRISADGTTGSAEVDESGSQGYVMDVYQNGIMLRGIDFQLGKFLPIASYFLDTTPIDVEEYVGEITITPTMEQGTISSTNGNINDSTEYIRTADYIEVVSGNSYILNNNSYDNSNNMCLFYDENKQFITKWNGEYNYKYISNGDSIVAPANAKYMKVRISTENVSTVLSITGEF